MKRQYDLWTKIRVLISSQWTRDRRHINVSCTFELDHVSTWLIFLGLSQITFSLEKKWKDGVYWHFIWIYSCVATNHIYWKPRLLNLYHIALSFKQNDATPGTSFGYFVDIPITTKKPQRYTSVSGNLWVIHR